MSKVRNVRATFDHCGMRVEVMGPYPGCADGKSMACAHFILLLKRMGIKVSKKIIIDIDIE